MITYQTAVHSGSLGRVLDWGLKGSRFKPHRQPSIYVVSLSETLYLLFSTGSTQEDQSWHDWNFFDWGVKNQTKQTNISN